MEDQRQAIARLRQGDISGLEVLVRKYQLEAVRTVYLITHDHALAEDIVQAAFVRVHERIHQYDPDRAFAPWFYRMVINDTLKAIHKRRRQVSLEGELNESGLALEDLLSAPAADPADEIERHELHQQVRQALSRLPPEQRASVILRYYLGWSESEMAEVMQVAQGTVKWRLHTARERLYKLLRGLFPQTAVVNSPVRRKE